MSNVRTRHDARSNFFEFVLHEITTYLKGTLRIRRQASAEKLGIYTDLQRAHLYTIRKFKTNVG